MHNFAHFYEIIAMFIILYKLLSFGGNLMLSNCSVSIFLKVFCLVQVHLYHVLFISPIAFGAETYTPMHM